MTDILFLNALRLATANAMTLETLITLGVDFQSRGEVEKAEQLYRIWIRFNPDHPNLPAAYFNCATFIRDPARLPDSIALLEKAIELNPDLYPAYINIGGQYEQVGRSDKALEAWQVVANRLSNLTGPNLSYKFEAYRQIGRVCIAELRSPPAEAALKAALELKPGQRDVIEQYVAQRLAQCISPVAAPFEGMSREALLAGFSPLSMLNYTDDPILHFAVAADYTKDTIDPTVVQDSPDRRHAPIDLTGRRLRVGYLSSDLREHAIGYLMAEYFEVHDRAETEVFVYDCGPPADCVMSARIKAAVEHWVTITDMDDRTAAERIAADGIDILVDVNGYTRFARTAVLGRRPAPIIVNWLGFPGTLGTPFHHYIIADDWIIPPGSEDFYAERVLRLPCYQPNDRRRIVAERPSRADAGLPDDAFVFCCFNGPQKFSKFTLARWVEILRRVDNGVLWLLDCDDEVKARLQGLLVAAGLAPDRLVFAPKLRNAHHLARYPLADLFLDTAPYGAHTTASDALWMGVPVVTMTGRGFASRVCGSLVRAAGLADLVCDDPQTFVDRAVELATAPERLADYRRRLEENRASCVLFDMDLLAASMQQLFRTMCAEYAAGDLPRPRIENVETYLQAGFSFDHDGVEMVTVEDYLGAYKRHIGRRHLYRPVPPDGRFWTEEDVRACEAQALAGPSAVTAS